MSAIPTPPLPSAPPAPEALKDPALVPLFAIDRELVKIGRTILTGSIPPKVVATGPVKQNILKGADVDLYEFPAPHWNRLDGGRYLLTYGGCVTRDPDTGVMNVGIYRGMVGGRDRIPILMWRAQHIGHHFTAWQNAGSAERCGSWRRHDSHNTGPYRGRGTGPSRLRDGARGVCR